MKTFKKALALLLVAALAAGIAVLGTVAYFTHEDEDINTFTIGNVEVELVEKQRNEDRTALEDFEDGKQLMPIVGSAATKEDTFGLPAPENYQDKIVYARNIGNSDAYMRIRIAVPVWENTVGTPDDASTNNLHWNWPSDTTRSNIQAKLTEAFKDSFSDTTVTGPAQAAETAWIDGQEYNVYTFTFDQAIAPNTATPVVMVGLYLDNDVDYNHETGRYVDVNGNEFAIPNNTAHIPVIVEAIQVDGFNTAAEAFAAANFDTNPWKETVIIETLEELRTALTTGGDYVLGANITADGTSLTIPAGITLNLDLNGLTITNPVVGGAAMENNGTLTITGNGAIVNGTNSTRASHTIVNNGTLIIEGGNIGTDDTAGAAVVNNGTTTINGGTFASKQENRKGDGLCAYAFINQTGSMTINDATLNGQTHGLFGANGGEIIVNGGNYTMDGNGGLGCYVVYASATAKVTLNGGIIHTNEPRNGNVFFVYDNGNYFDANAVATGKVVVNGATIYLNGVEQTY